MATQDKNGKIRGKINNVVYRELGDKQVMQIIPGRVRQTDATKLAAMEFGLASAHARVIRTMFTTLYEESDGKMSGRLNAAVAACLRTSDKEIGERDLHDTQLDPLKGFSFNTHAPFEKRVAVRPTFGVRPNGQFDFTLPTFNVMKDIAYPPVDLRYRPSFLIAVTAFHFREEYAQVINKQVFDFENIDQSAEITWSSSRQLPKGAIILVTFSLRYVSANWSGRSIQYMDKAYYPTVILDAFHVTDEMVTLANEAGLLVPTTRISLFSSPTKDLLQDMQRFKNKIEKKQE